MKFVTSVQTVNLLSLTKYGPNQ